MVCILKLLTVSLVAEKSLLCKKYLGKIKATFSDISNDFCKKKPAMFLVISSLKIDE